MMVPSDILQRVSHRVQEVLISRQDFAVGIKLNNGHGAVQGGQLCRLICIVLFSFGERQHNLVVAIFSCGAFSKKERSHCQLPIRC